MKPSLILLALVFSCTAAHARPNFQAQLLQGKKGKTDDHVQWTLADWLTQKNKISLMDQWLAMHMGARWFEFSASGASQELTIRTTTGATTATNTAKGQIYTANIQLSILNLNGEYQKTDDDREAYGGAAGLRLLGSSLQGTNLIARYGWRRTIDLKAPEHWDNQYAEGSLQIYILQAIGIRGEYRYYFPADSDLGNRMQGHRVTAGAFLEFIIFRIHADYFQEPMQISTNGTVTSRAGEGFQGGLSLYF